LFYKLAFGHPGHLGSICKPETLPWSIHYVDWTNGAPLPLYTLKIHVTREHFCCIYLNVITEYFVWSFTTFSIFVGIIRRMLSVMKFLCRIYLMFVLLHYICSSVFVYTGLCCVLNSLQHPFLTEEITLPSCPGKTPQRQLH
jgi:hypothetical protein